MRIKYIAALAAVGAVTLVGSATPASAGHPLLAAFVGTAATSGTWAPASPACPTEVTTLATVVIDIKVTNCISANSWSFVSDTDVVLPYDIGTTGSGRVSGSGTFSGWCGRSQGSGSFSLAGVNGSVSWQSAGTIIVLTGSAGGYIGPAAAVVAARAAAGTGNCVTAPATAFNVVGVAAVVA